eukprot:CAMPEP_0203812792 /NCGR_PEP_ID=MMETSP0115-20131106/4352_1 /ASSEMBLY_ACC=CAM_ASM_000227 /TAXON_ID=33651 /ORGANISM="Bicosoecid sp, Strain ms1" /LENGTH=67 /DNA_ID=CAMNT_0050721643 /DNA_START=153 /DNA_END=353 /DNA_ORIENTATION=+
MSASSFPTERQVEHVYAGFEPDAASPIVISSLAGPGSPAGGEHAAFAFDDAPPQFPDGRQLSSLRGA